MRHRSAGNGIARQMAWGLETVLATEKRAPMKAKSATKEMI